jgi:release factor glutamine methyltransferase
MMLAECLEREQLHPWCSVLDLCTGSGLLAVSAARRASRVVAVDVSWRALLAVRANARLNGVAVQAVRGDLFAAVPNQRFDLIVSNPPYLPGRGADVPRRGAARAWEGGPRGRSFLDRICTQTRNHLRPGGVLLLVHSSVCSIPETLHRLTQQDLDPTIVATHEGPLGARLRSRTDWLRQQGLLADGNWEQLVVIRAQRPPA